MFRSTHSRQASRYSKCSGGTEWLICKWLRTDSIYTLRQTPTNYKQRIFWWQRGKGKDKEEEVAAIKIIS